jgi:chromosome segregation ATPase
MTKQRCFGIAMAATSVVVVAGAVVIGQGQRSPATLDDLLAELRGLRADASQTASASIRAQLLMGRLQLQEQRIITVSGQLAVARQQLTAVEGGIAQVSANLKRLEETSTTGGLSADDQTSLDREIAGIKATLKEMQQNAGTDRDREGELTSLLASEQGRWTDFNGRLDDLEQSLLKGPPR